MKNEHAVTELSADFEKLFPELSVDGPANDAVVSDKESSEQLEASGEWYEAWEMLAATDYRLDGVEEFSAAASDVVLDSQISVIDIQQQIENTIDEAADSSDDFGSLDDPEFDAEAQPKAPLSAELETDLETETQQEPFDGFNSAREFLSNGASVSGLVNKLSKPPVNDLHSSPMFEPAPTNGSNPMIQMGLGKAALLTGAYGLSKLSKVISGGAGLIAGQISTFQLQGAEKKLGGSISTLNEKLDGLRADGLSVLDSPEHSLDERQELARQYFSEPENKVKLNELFELADGLRRNAATMIEKAAHQGEQPDVVANRALEPIKRFAEENERFLESLKKGDQTLLEKVDNVMNSLFEMLKKLFTRLAQAIGVGASDQKSAQPRLG